PALGTLSVHDEQSGRELYRIVDPKLALALELFSLDGRLLAVTRFDSTGQRHSVKVLDAASGRQLSTTDAQGWPVAFSPDGRRLALLSRNEASSTIILWDTETSTEVLRLRNHPGRGTVAFTPDGRSLLHFDDLSPDRTVTIWDATPLGEQPGLPATQAKQ